VKIVDGAWAFNASKGNRLVVVDVHTGKQLRTIDVGPRQASSAGMIGDTSKLIVLSSTTRENVSDIDAAQPTAIDQIAIVDLRSSKVTRHRLAACHD
jgi:hypothetical protein